MRRWIEQFPQQDFEHGPGSVPVFTLELINQLDHGL